LCSATTGALITASHGSPTGVGGTVVNPAPNRRRNRPDDTPRRDRRGPASCEPNARTARCPELDLGVTSSSSRGAGARWSAELTGDPHTSQYPSWITPPHSSTEQTPVVRDPFTTGKPHKLQ